MSKSEKFNRYLSDDFLQILKDLSETDQSNWWQDILADDKLVIAVRTNELDVYYKGMSLFKIQMNSKQQLVPQTNGKFLTRTTDTTVKLSQDGEFNVSKKLHWEKYRGRKTLKEMKTMAGNFAGVEDKGIYDVLIQDRRFIDIEVSFDTGKLNKKGNKKYNRIDIAIVVNVDDPTVIFVEAKDFSNRELRAKNTTPPVLDQIDRYNLSLKKYKTDISESYLKVAQTLVKIEEMRANVRPNYVKPKGFSNIEKITTAPKIDPESCLLIFGFDEAQRNAERWDGTHLLKLTQKLGAKRVHAAKSPTTFVSSKMK